MKLFTSFYRTTSSQSTLHCELHNQTESEKKNLMRDKPKPEKPAPGRPSDVRQVAANTLIFGLSLAEKIAECAPVPGLKGAISTLNLILNRSDVRFIHNLTGRRLTTALFAECRAKLARFWRYHCIH
jgi:hypothetical protein